MFERITNSVVLYLLTALLGFAVFWATANAYFVWPARVILVLILVPAALLVLRYAITFSLQLFLMGFVVMLAYYIATAMSSPSILYHFKPLIMGIFIQFFLGTALGISSISATSASLSKHLRLTAIALLICIGVVASVNEAHYVSSERANLYQTFSAYALKPVIFISLLISLEDYRFSRTQMWLKVVWSLTAALCFLVGSKKETSIAVAVLSFLVLYPWFEMKRISLLKINKKTLTDTLSSILLTLAVISAIFVTGISKISLGYFFEMAEFSIVKRLEFIKEGTLDQLMFSYGLGHPYAHDHLGAIYLHSTLLSLPVGFGLFWGPIFCYIICSTMLARHEGSVFWFIKFCVLGMALFATFYDWQLLWYVLGLSCGHQIAKIKA